MCIGYKLAFISQCIISNILALGFCSTVISFPNFGFGHIPVPHWIALFIASYRIVFNWIEIRSYCISNQWDPCGEGEPLQVPGCKHFRGPSLDYTHSNSGKESQAKTVPSATTEEIPGLTSNPENFLFRGHRKCIDSVHLNVLWKRLQSGLQSLSCALSWAHLRVCSPLSSGHLPQTLQKQSC